MLAFEQVQQLATKYTVQLEGFAYNKQRELAHEVRGAVHACFQILSWSQEKWRTECYEKGTALAEAYVRQLEGLAFSKKRDLAISIRGGINACILILDRDGKSWNARTEKAMAEVMMNAPAIATMTEDHSGLPAFDSFTTALSQRVSAAMKAVMEDAPPFVAMPETGPALMHPGLKPGALPSL